MLSMFKRVAVWAQHFKVVKIIVFAVSVFVMYAKNFWVLAIAASLARQQHAASMHVFAHSRKIRPPNLFCGFVYACFRTIFAFVRRRAKKFDAAVRACVFHGAFTAHGFVIALRRTVLGFVGAASNVAKHCSALFASRSHLHSGVKRKTLAAAVDCGVFAVRRHRKRGATLFADFFIANAGAGHAFSQVGLQRSV